MIHIKEHIRNTRVKLLGQKEAAAGVLSDALINTGGTALFIARFFKEIAVPPYEFKEIVIQCYKIGYKSLFLVSITGFIMGLVLTLQSRPVLSEFGAESWLPGMVSLSLLKEIGPVITSLICAGKVGSSIGAELGSMRVTEQIDAMEVSGINPFKYLVVTRTFACLITIPLLVLYGDIIGIMGAYVAVNINSKYSLFLYFNQSFATVTFSDFLPAFIKTFFFGFVIGIISCYKGFHATNGTESVGIAANSAVVVSSLLLFVVDMFAVQITNLLT